MNYTEKVDGFQIVDVSYFPGFEPKYETPRFDVVKWYQHEPIDAVDLTTGQKKTSTESCFVVARLVWDAHEPGFDFESIGTRWLECKPTRKVIKMIQDFVREYDAKLSEQNDEIIKRQRWITCADYCLCPSCGRQSGSPTRFCPYCGRRVFQ